MRSLIAPPGRPVSAGTDAAQALFREARRRRRQRWLAGIAAVLVTAAVVAVSAVTWLPRTLGQPQHRTAAAGAAVAGRSAAVSYVRSQEAGTVTPIFTATNTAGTPVKVGDGPGAIAITPDGRTIYVASYRNTVTPIFTATNTAGTPIKVGKTPTAIAVTPDGKTVYVANLGSGTVTPISTATNTPDRPIAVDGNP